LVRFGSPGLGRDVESFGPILEGAADGSLDDFLASMAQRSPEAGQVNPVSEQAHDR